MNTLAKNHSIRKFFSQLFHSNWFFPIFLLVICSLTYAYQITQMGFYWDDWPIVFLARLHNPSLFWSYFLFDRPFSAWTDLITIPILNTTPLNWQLLTITLRWITALGFWWTLRGIWPSRSFETGWMTLLMAVYPGFMQQSISVAYSQHFFCYALFTVSLGLMVWGVQRRSYGWLLIALSVITTTIQIFTMEYFLGLEVLRPVILWILLRDRAEGIRTVIRKTLKYWAPYLPTLIIFLFWRLFLYEKLVPASTAHMPALLEAFRSQPFSSFVTLVEYSLEDFLTTNLSAWSQTAMQNNFIMSAKANLFAWIASISAALVAIYYFPRMEYTRQNEVRKTDHFLAQGVVLGLVGFFSGGLPVWLIGNQISAGKWSDRFTLAPMFGAIILVVCLVSWFGASKMKKGIILGGIFAMAMLFQVKTTYSYRLSWDQQVRYYWQMVWRIPALKPGTTLLASITPAIPMTTEYDFGFAVNSIYNDNPQSTSLVYWFLAVYNHLGEDIPALSPGLPITYSLRSFTFNGSTSQSLVIEDGNTSACLHILGPDDSLSPDLTADDVRLLNLSDLNLIINSNESTLPKDIFGPEPAHTWCYYYEKADLAAQFGDWQEVVQLGNEAIQKSFKPKLGMEWIPFIEGYAQIGDWSQAKKITDQAAERSANMGPYLCATWKRIIDATSPSPDRNQVVAAINQDYQCTPPGAP